MELSSQAIQDVEFTVVRRGYDPEEVRSFLSRLAAGLDEMRSHLVASDARARAAMARVQELSAKDSSGDADTISKALVMAQRAADAAISDAQRQASSMVAAAEQQSQGLLADAHAQAQDVLQTAEIDAKVRLEQDLAVLAERRLALSNEVDHLGGQVVSSRDRVAEAIELLQGALRSALVVSGPGPSLSSLPPLDDRPSPAPDPFATYAAMARPTDAVGETVRVSMPGADTGPLTIVVDPWEAQQQQQLRDADQ